MKHVAILAAACVALSGCAGMTDLIGVNEKATPKAQVIKATADAKLTEKFADRLDHCHILGNATFKAEVSASSGLNLSNGMDCLPKPWETPTTDTAIMAKAIEDAVDRALAKRDLANKR